VKKGKAARCEEKTELIGTEKKKGVKKNLYFIYGLEGGKILEIRSMALVNANSRIFWKRGGKVGWGKTLFTIRYCHSDQLGLIIKRGGMSKEILIFRGNRDFGI